MPIFIVSVASQNTKNFAVNCGSAEEARVIVGQSFQGASDNPNVVLIADNLSGSTEVSQEAADAKWSDYTEKRLR